MASVAKPLLLAFTAPTALAVVILVLVTSFRTGSDSGYYYLSGVKGPLFLLFASLSVVTSVLIYKPLNSLLLYSQAWRTIKCADLLRSSQSADSQSTVPGSKEGVHMDLDAIACLNGVLLSLGKGLASSRRPDSGISTGSLIISGVFWLLLIIIFGVLLAADIWLHVMLQTNNVSTSQSSPRITPGRALGRALSTSCTQATPQTGSWQVTLGNDFCTNRFDIVQNDTEAYATLSGTSNVNRILTIPRGYNGQDVAIITDEEAGAVDTYVTSSYGIVTQCRPIPNGCDLNVTNGQYNCSGSDFAGYVTQQADFSMPSLNNSATDFFVAAQLYGPEDVFSDSLSGGATSLSSARDSVFIAMSCTAQAVHLSYIFQSGIPRAQSVELVDDQTQWLMLAPMFPGQVLGYTNFGLSEWISGVTATATAGRVKSSQDLAMVFASIFSQTAISSSAGIMVPSALRGSGSDDSTGGSITLLPKAPILIVIILDFVYAFLALILGTTAIVLSLRDERVQSIQAQLTYKGALAAAMTHAPTNSSGTPCDGSERNTERSNSRGTDESHTSHNKESGHRSGDVEWEQHSSKRVNERPDGPHLASEKRQDGKIS